MMKIKFITALSLSAFMSINVAMAEQIGRPALGEPVLPKPDFCKNYQLPPTSEKYIFVSKKTDVTHTFIAAAEHAGYNNGLGIPQSFKNQKQVDYCYMYVDPLGFPHHISKIRACGLTVSGGFSSNGLPVGLTAKLNHSGCYLKSSRRHLNRLIQTPFDRGR